MLADESDGRPSPAAEHAATIEDGLRAIEEYEAECGKITDAERAQADEVLRRHGIVLP